MTPLVVTVVVGATAFVLGVLVGYLLGRPRKRPRSSIDLGYGAPRGRYGRHRGRR